MKRLLWASLLLIVILRATSRPAPPHPWFSSGKLLAMAHQGGEKLWPSNTMLGFRESFKLGADVLDADAQLSKDGVLVLIHDTSVDRTTNGRGRVADLTVAELQALDAGYRFSPDRGKTFPFRGKGCRIPTLEELLLEFPGMRIGLELKQTDPSACRVLIELLERLNARERVLLSSFRYELLKDARGVLATSATPNEARLFWGLSKLHLEGFYSPPYEALQVPLTSGGLQVLNERFVTAAHNRGLKVLPWTLDTAEEIRYARGLGVDGINSNVPDLLIRELE